MRKTLVVLLALCLLLSACSAEGGELSSEEPVESSLPPMPSQPEPEEIAAKETLRWAQSADVTTLDPHNGVLPDWQVTCNLFDTLLTTGEEGTLEPGLAERWEQTDDTTWRFTLRRGVRFHDGSLLTAEDVIFSLERASASPAADYIKDIEAVGDYTLTVTTTEPYAPFGSALAHPSSAILSQPLVEENPDHFFRPVGTGPYRFIERVVGESVTLSANESYFGGAPRTKTLVMTVIPDPSKRIEALEKGAVDLAYDIPITETVRVSTGMGLKLISAPSMTIWHIAFNTQKAPFDNVLVRQAVCHAIDEGALLRGVRQGVGEASASLIPPGAIGQSFLRGYSHDIEAARSLLSEAGYPFGFSCTLWVNENAEREAVCAAIKTQLMQVGIDVTVKVADYGSFLHRTSEGEHDMAYLGLAGRIADADAYYYTMTHTKGAENRAHFSDGEADRLIEAARAAEDETQRLESYGELAALLERESPYAPLYCGAVCVGATADLADFTPDPYGYHRLDGAFRPEE